MKTNSTSTEVSTWSGIKQKIRKVLYWIISLIVIIAGIFIYYKYYYTYSDGYRAGLLQKFSHQGNLFKTYEGEIILNDVTSNTTVALASEKFFFSVTSQDLAKQLDTIQGHMVIVHYLQKNGALLWRGDSKYMVDSVKCLR
jgi:hypothetical protein